MLPAYQMIGSQIRETNMEWQNSARRMEENVDRIKKLETSEKHEALEERLARLKKESPKKNGGMKG